MIIREIIEKILTENTIDEVSRLISRIGMERTVDAVEERIEESGKIVVDVTDSPFGEKVWCTYEGRRYALLMDPEFLDG